MAGLSESLEIFEKIETAAIASAELAVEIATNSLELARRTRPVTLETASLGREQADVAVRQAELALQTAQDGGADLTIRAANIALQNAQLAQDQATAARLLATTSQGTSVEQAQLSLQTAQAALSSTRAQMASQKQQVTSQMRVAREQLKLSQVIAPVKGEVTRLVVKVGDFVRPAQELGEVQTLRGATARIFVSTGIRQALRPGQTVQATSETGAALLATVTHLSSAPAATTGLWQVTLAMAELPPGVYGGSLITVHLPVGTTHAATVFIPLDTLTIRQSGTVIFTVEPGDMVAEHAVSVVGFDGGFVEISTDLPGEARIITSGNRRLNNGDRVTITK
jgi:RND family efflux transporter MFP subunit